MCGIIGYIGPKKADEVLLEGLKRLEYRGYDSSGVGVVTNDNKEIIVRKIKGKIDNLRKHISDHKIPHNSIGISHTRWATHGEPSKENAHPHQDCQNKFCIVHNGIIENYESLKVKLIEQGHKFSSDTDTEVIVHLLESYYDGDFLNAVKKTIEALNGSFALGIICIDFPNTLIAVRRGSPLVLGLGESENFLASDITAILSHTKDVVYLEDGQIAILKDNDIELLNFSGEKCELKIDKIEFSLEEVAKQGYDHFMLKEIHEQPNVIKEMLNLRINDGQINFSELGFTDDKWNDFDKIVIVACGTAYHAAMVGKYLIEELAQIPVTIDVSSEFRYRNPLIDSKNLVIAVSQSGETADTLAAVSESKVKNATVCAICNVVGSTLARDADGVIYTHAGPEIGVASTKAYIAQIMIFYLLAIKLGQIKGKLLGTEYNKIISSLNNVPKHIEEVLEKESEISAIAKKNRDSGCFLFLGRHINFPSALEGALKLKEISYIPAEGYAAGEMKHGPIALIDEYRAVVCIAPDSSLYEKMYSNIQEIYARKGRIIAIVSDGNQGLDKYAKHIITIPKVIEIITPLLVIIPLQLLAYYISVELGCDVDQPRNLAKSVTVE